MKEILVVRKRNELGVSKSKVLGAAFFCIMMNDCSVRVEDDLKGAVSQAEAEVRFLSEAVPGKACIEATKL